MQPEIGIRVAKPEDAAAIARVRVDSWRTTYRGVLPGDYLDGLSYEENTRNWKHILAGTGRHNFAYVAEDPAGKVVGFVLGGIERTNNPSYTGEIYAIYLLHSHQRMGIGRALIRAIMRRLVQEGMYSLLIWVLSQNPARAFYAALGGKPLYEKNIVIGSSTFKEVAYVWPDIRSIAGLAEDL